MRRHAIRGIVIALAVAVGISGLGSALAGPTVRLSIATGGTGGVYFPLGGGLASLISKHIPGVSATA